MLFRLGIVAIIASFLPWLALALAPLVGLSLAGAAGFLGAAVIAAEIMFWGGLALVGKDTWRAIKANGWRRAPRALVRLLIRGRPRYWAAEWSLRSSRESPLAGRCRQGAHSPTD